MIALAALTLALLPATPPPTSPPPTSTDPRVGTWRAVLTSPGGELPFGLELGRAGAGWTAVVLNGPERIELTEVGPSAGGDTAGFVLGFPHFASRVIARVEEDGERLVGEWTKRSSGGKTSRLPFEARFGAAPRFRPESRMAPTRSVAGRWAVRFESSDDLAVGVFEQSDSGAVTGTFLTTTGDYRYLAGSLDGDRLRLSCFDGAHAFLFDATLTDDDGLDGHFWSRDSWHETWSGQRDPAAQLDDPWLQTATRTDPALALYYFQNRSGHVRNLAEPVGANVRLIHVFGSWCPNCHDEGPYLEQLAERYGAALELTGVAFELSGDFDADAAQVTRYAKRYGLEHPLFVVGTADKRRAAQAFPMLTSVRSFPTTIFVDRAGVVRGVYSGFSGPGTGAENERLRAAFERRLDELTAEQPADDTWRALTQAQWTDPRTKWHVTFHPTEAEGPEGAVTFSRLTGNIRRRKPAQWRAVGPTVYLKGFVPEVEDARSCAGWTANKWRNETFWHFDPRALVLLDGTDFGHRMMPRANARAAVVDGTRIEDAAALAAALDAADPVLRREATYAVAVRIADGELLELDFDPTPLIADEDPWVRCVAAWAAGHCRVEAARNGLIVALGHGHASLRREAASALGKLTADQATTTALRALESDYDPFVRAAAAVALGALAE